MTARLVLLALLCSPLACAGAAPSPAPTRATPPPPIDAAPVLPSPNDATLMPCHEHADCPPGLFCRDRGDHTTLCLGHGSRGDYCSDTIDCREPLFCRLRQGKLRMCM